jgi:hypothetical protein
MLPICYPSWLLVESRCCPNRFVRPSVLTPRLTATCIHVLVDTWSGISRGTRSRDSGLARTLAPDFGLAGRSGCDDKKAALNILCRWLILGSTNQKEPGNRAGRGRLTICAKHVRLGQLPGIRLRQGGSAERIEPLATLRALVH